YTFAKVLRAVLRQDPNIILVGEIRDQETAEIALKASMTGHLVLSTLHTNFASMAPSRLADMGIKPYLIVAALKIVIAQRLIRLLCADCKVKAELNKDELLQLPEEAREKVRDSYGPKGCRQCGGIGYKGRKAIIEVLPVKSHEMRQLIFDCANPDKVAKQAIS